MNFFNPLLLSGLGLVAVPIIIHWLFRRRYRRIDWAAIRFLLEAQRETRRRRQFEQWLLLALRCLAVALLVMFLARPFVQAGGIASLFASSEPVERIIVLDDTASLNYRQQNATEFAGVQQTAAQLLTWIGEAAPNDRITILRWTAPEEPLFDHAPADTLTLREMQRTIASLTPTPLPGSFTVLLGALRERIDQDEETRQCDIHLITDQQAEQFADLTPNRLREFAGEDSGVRWIIMPAGAEPRDNLAITAVEAEQPYAIAGQPVRIRATLHNYGRAAADNLDLGVAIDNDPIPGMTVEHLPPGGTVTVEHELVLAEPGYPAISVSLPQGDPYDLDDHFRIVLPTKPALQVLVISERDEQAGRADSSHFIEQALAPPGPFSSGIMVTTMRPNDLTGATLTTYDAVILLNVAELESAAIEALQTYVNGGGGLAFFTGSRISDVTNFNALFYAGGEGLFPVELRRRVHTTTEAIGMVREIVHPLTVAIPEAIETTAPLVRFQTYYSSATPEHAAPAAPPTDATTTSAKVLARFTDAEHNAALVEHRFGHGRVVACLSSIDLQWNNWPAAIDGSFVITMLELVRYLSGEAAHPAALTVGDPATMTVSLDAYEPQATLRPPNYPTATASEVMAELTPDASGLAALTGPATDQLGEYEFVLTPRAGVPEMRPIAVNADPRESDLVRATPEQLEEWFAGSDFVLANTANDNQTARAARSEIWRPLLMVLIATLLIESLLAWWFAHDAQRRKAPTMAGLVQQRAVR